MYDFLARVSNTDAPIVFKGGLITKLILSENVFVAPRMKCVGRNQNKERYYKATSVVPHTGFVDICVIYIIVLSGGDKKCKKAVMNLSEVMLT